MWTFLNFSTYDINFENHKNVEMTGNHCQNHNVQRESNLLRYNLIARASIENVLKLF